MMVLFNGRERTAEEFAGLLGAAGLRLGGVTPTAAGLNVIEGIPI
jgi:hypothetical protein